MMMMTPHLTARTVFVIATLCCLTTDRPATADDRVLDVFHRQQLTDVYYSEGANAGDIDHDGVMDVVHGPFWFRGPDYKTRYEIYAPAPQDRNRYANNFFSWVHDVNGDGRNDVLTVGFPGTAAFVYENPGPDGFGSTWPKHTVFDWVSNESPQFTNLVGDATPELVCTRDGRFGYVTINPDKPFGLWSFHAISDKITATRFGHGLGVGDVDGDGRLDVLMKDGWFRQPESVAGDPPWTLHKTKFAAAGGADMYAYDVDGDGDNDVITSLNAHNYGLAWYEQTRDGETISFRQHLIMGDKPEQNRYGVVFTEPHAVNLVDIDGDGLKDIVTGKTYWSHHKQSPMWDAGAVVYWFRLVRGEDGVDWVPYKADGESGIGRQLSIGDLNGDELPDMIVGGMKGAHVLIHERKEVSESEWRSAQPQPRKELQSGLTPEEAAKNMTVPAGFRVQLAAGEPMVHQPIAFTFDHRGRLWLAEAYTYPLRAPEGEGKDRIIILEDTDLDGTFDSRKVFIEGLNLVSGLEVGFGGVYVGAAPYLMFIPDRDGDDRPDPPTQSSEDAGPVQFPKDVPDGARVLLDGFGWQDTHETLNAFIWGPDGWLYGCHGVFTHSRVGRPGTPDADRTGLNAGVWRYHPQRHLFEVFAHGTSNPWGVDFNSRGEAFVTACVIPHLFHIIPGARYQRQAGQHFNAHTYADIKTIADHLHYTGNIRDHAWWGHEPDVPKGTDDAGGGHAHCGAMIYLGDNWPPEYRDHIFFNNIHGNRVNCDLLEPHGSGFVGHHGRDLLLANDRWFRGINLKCAPDGSVYLIDWYDKNACHRRTPEIWDRTNGRIYRISYGDVKPHKVDLAAASSRELARFQTHRNEWYARTARRLLQERGTSQEVTEELATLIGALAVGNADVLEKHDDRIGVALRALWGLHVVGGLEPFQDVNGIVPWGRAESAGFGEAGEALDAWLIRLAVEDGKVSTRQLSQLRAMARNTRSPVVRLSLASALQRLPVAERWDIASALVAHADDADDHNLPLMYWYAIEPLVPADPSRALQLAWDSKIPLVRDYVVRRAASEEQSLEKVVAALHGGQDDARQLLVLDALLDGFEGRVNIPMPAAWKGAYEHLMNSSSESVRDKADQVAILLGDSRIYPRMRERLADTSASMASRRAALDILVRGRDRGAVGTWLQVLDEPQLRGPAIRALAAFDDDRTAPRLIAAYGAFNSTEKNDAVSTLVGRPATALALLDAIEGEHIPRTDLHAYHIRQLERFKNPKLAERIRTVWGDIRESSADKKARITALKQQLSPATLKSADVGNGRRLFDKTCASCHTLFGSGGRVGPDITGSNRANLDYILENVVDPGAVLGRDYRMSTFVLADGRLVNGLVQKETDSALTVRTINDTVVVARDDIEEQKLSDQSLMPERLLDDLSAAEVRDLIAYLGAGAQVPLKGPSAPIDSGTGRVAGALEGEALKILSTSAGSARSQPMGNFRADRWSGSDHLWWTGGKPGARLTLEVPARKAGDYELEVVLTRARDYGIVQMYFDDRALGAPIDLFNTPDVITTGVASFKLGPVREGAHKLTLEITGANPEAVKSFMVGLDYVRLRPAQAGAKSE